MLLFDRFRFDAANRRLTDASGAIRLNPKAFEVLRVLLERPGELVSKDDLLDAVWRDAHVADGVLKVCITEIRGALGDSATTPRFIETIHRRGYRFIASVRAAAAGSEAAEPDHVHALRAWPPGDASSADGVRGLVGRDREIAELEERLERALAGERQTVFVSGDAGAGKTTLVEELVARAAERGTALAITGGQCLEHFGAAEAYMPVLEAIGRLVREPGAPRSLLRRYAPAWFAQLPWLIEDDDRDRLARELLGGARERMLREMAEFTEAFGAAMPLVLVLEDLQWSDPSTVDLLSLLATRREPARLLLLATYRPVDAILAQHPLRAVVRQLSARRLAAEIALEELDVEAVAAYVRARFAGGRFPADLARVLRTRSDGNPLFMVTLV